MQPARHLASRKTRVIGLLLTNMHNDFFGPLLSGIETVVRMMGYNLIVATYRHDLDGDGDRIPIGVHNSDGLLVFADSLRRSISSDILRKEISHCINPPYTSS